MSWLSVIATKNTFTPQATFAKIQGTQKSSLLSLFFLFSPIPPPPLPTKCPKNPPTMCLVYF